MPERGYGNWGKLRGAKVDAGSLIASPGKSPQKYPPPARPRCAQLWATEDERAEGIRLAREALDSHRDDPITLGLAGHAIGYLGHEYEVDRHASDRAIALNPNSATNFRRRGFLEMWLDNFDAAEDAIRRAMRLSPLDPDMGWMLFTLANTHTKAGRLEEGLGWARRNSRDA